jgi:hypothetical protein
MTRVTVSHVFPLNDFAVVTDVLRPVSFIHIVTLFAFQVPRVLDADEDEEKSPED